jgi:HD superfamily phosphohydrolase YqeK
MVHRMDEGFERELEKTVKPYLDRGRPGDYKHTLRAVEYGKELLQHEEGEEGIVMPALYLHDIGWGEVNFDDFINITLPSQKRDAASVDLHMKHGAALAKKILEKLGCPMETRQAIVSIIAVHDRPEKIFAMENASATLVFEADYLDKFGAQSLYRFETMFKMKPVTEIVKKDAAVHLREGLKVWFKTRTAKRMALQLAKESGLFEDSGNP